jgi:hypothetical protein
MQQSATDQLKHLGEQSDLTGMRDLSGLGCRNNYRKVLLARCNSQQALKCKDLLQQHLQLDFHGPRQ